MHGRALITGASSGIGRDLAELLAKDGYDLVLASRDEAKLAEAAVSLRRHGVDVRILPVDLSRPGTAAGLLASLHAEGLVIDVLVNNAGRGVLGPFAHADAGVEAGMMRLHMDSLVELTRPLLQGMLARGRGRILNVASTAAFLPGPLMAVYYASKAFVVHFSEALWEETRGTGVSVTVLCPGPTKTGFLAASGMRETGLFAAARMPSMRVAKCGYRAMLAGRRRAVPGLWNALGVLVSSLAPRALSLPMIRSLQEPAMHPEPKQMRAPPAGR